MLGKFMMWSRIQELRWFQLRVGLCGGRDKFDDRLRNGFQIDLE